jgi:pimeloyl-ACP methyl ester carboxylesterase
MVGHSNGGDIAMYFAKLHPDQVRKVVTLDNLRVPFMTDGKFKILSFRSHDPVFKADPGVVPNGEVCDEAGITVINTDAQHTEMSDRGPNSVKQKIEGMLDKYLDNDSVLAPVDTKKPKITNPGPVAQVAPPLALVPAAVPLH